MINYLIIFSTLFLLVIATVFFIKNFASSIKVLFESPLIGVVFFLIFIGIPLFANSLFKWKFSFETNNDWIGFWGSYFGGVWGGTLTLLGVVLTISHYNKKEKEEKAIKTIQEIRRKYFEMYYEYLLKISELLFIYSGKNRKPDCSIHALSLSNHLYGKKTLMDKEKDRLIIDIDDMINNFSEYSKKFVNFKKLATNNLEVAEYISDCFDMFIGTNGNVSFSFPDEDKIKIVNNYIHEKGFSYNEKSDNYIIAEFKKPIYLLGEMLSG